MDLPNVHLYSNESHYFEDPIGYIGFFDNLYKNNIKCLEFWIEHVTIGLLYVKLVFSTSIVHSLRNLTQHVQFDVCDVY